MKSQKSKTEEYSDMSGKVGWLFMTSILEAQKTFICGLQKAMQDQKPDESFNLWQEWMTYATDWAQGLQGQLEKMQRFAAEQMQEGMGSMNAGPWQVWASLATDFAQNYMQLLTSMAKSGREQKAAGSASVKLWEDWINYTTNFAKFMNDMQRTAMSQRPGQA